jgi:hypothetical protein
MPQLVEMDRHVSLFEQMEQRVGPVILINTFTVEPRRPTGCKRPGRRTPRS